jgi:hypothetical protein
MFSTYESCRSQCFFANLIIKTEQWRYKFCLLIFAILDCIFGTPKCRLFSQVQTAQAPQSLVDFHPMSPAFAYSFHPRRAASAATWPVSAVMKVLRPVITDISENVPVSDMMRVAVV